MSASGPVARASGVTRDLRKDEPYLAYSDFDFQVCCATAGDCFARYLVRMDEIKESLAIVHQALDQFPSSGPIEAENLPRALRPEPGEIYWRQENPRGEYGIYMVSDGTTQPWRMKVRSPCFHNLSSLRHQTLGLYLADAVVALGSVDIVLGEVDR